MRCVVGATLPGRERDSPARRPLGLRVAVLRQGSYDRHRLCSAPDPDRGHSGALARKRVPREALRRGPGAHRHPGGGVGTGRPAGHDHHRRGIAGHVGHRRVPVAAQRSANRAHGAHPHPRSQQARAGAARGRPAGRRLGFSPLPARPRGALAQPRDLPAGEARRRRRERVLCCRASAPDRLRRRPEPEVFADRPCRLAPASHYGSANRHTRAGLLVDASFRRVHGGLQGSPRMKAMRLWPAVLLGAASLLILGCGARSPLGVPSQALTPHSALIDGPLAPTGLLTCQPLPYDSATQTIGPEGGTIQIGAYSLVIPAGALAAPTMITAVVVSGPVNAVRFQPEGLQFEQTAYLTMSYANCDLLGSIAPKQIAYPTDALGILEYLLSADDLLAQRVTGELHHFSEYAIAW